MATKKPSGLEQFSKGFRPSRTDEDGEIGRREIIEVNVPSADEPHQQSNGERHGISLENPSKERLPQNYGTEGEGAGMFQGSCGFAIYGGTFIQNNNAQGTVSAKDLLDQFPIKHNFRSIQIDTLEKVTQNTGSWFLDKEEFQRWFETKGGMLWGIGAPGAGKTFLASLVIDHLQHHAAHVKPTITVAFIYCRYSEEITLVDILATLVRQQLERDPSLSSVVDTVLARHRLEKTSPSQADLLAMLKGISQRVTRSFHIIDALDELPKAMRSKLLKLLTSINANVFLTSRPLESLKVVAPDAIYVDIVARDGDLKLFVSEKITSNPDFCALLDESGVQHKVIDSIVEKCAGRFLHAALQIESLQHCCSLADLEEAMEQLPPGVDELYKSDMKRIEDQPKKQAKMAKHMLLWVINTTRSITFEDLQFALTFSEETKTFNPKGLVRESLLLSLCCGLLTVERESRLVRLVHYTAKEVLQPLLVHEYPQPDALIADACISRLISCHFQSAVEIVSIKDLRKAYKANPLLSYAHDSFVAHASQCDHSTGVRGRVAEFVQQCHSFPRPVDANYAWDQDNKMNGLHTAAYYGFVDVLGTLLEDGGSPFANLANTNGWTALMFASQNGHEGVVRLLLAVNGIAANLANNDGWTALMVASEDGHEGVVRLLLAVNGIAANLANNDGYTALMVASQNGHEGVVRLLLDVNGIAANFASNDGWTALMLASQNGHEGVVRLLLDVNGIATNLANKYGSTDLMFASQNGHEGVVRLLLDVNGIAANLANNDGYTALMVASQNGHEGVVRLLLDVNGIAANLANNDGWTALMVASQNGHEGVVRLLLDVNGIAANFANNDGWTALMLASLNGHEGVVRLLVDVNGIAANIANNNGSTALMLASQNGHEGVVRLLNGPGIDVNLCTHWGSTALMLAAEHAPQSVSKALLQVAGIQTHFADNDGDTALILTLERDHEDVVALILETPCAVNAATHVGGWTALMFASSEGQEDAVRLLLEHHDVDVQMKDKFGITAVEWAQIYGHKAIVKLLKEYSRSPQI